MHHRILVSCWNGSLRVTVQNAKFKLMNANKTLYSDGLYHLKSMLVRIPFISEKNGSVSLSSSTMRDLFQNKKYLDTYK